jgi:hypothetical protein
MDLVKDVVCVRTRCCHDADGRGTLLRDPRSGRVGERSRQEQGAAKPS